MRSPTGAQALGLVVILVSVLLLGPSPAPLASLGAPLQGPWQQRSEDLGPYGTLVGLAGPIWSKEFDEFL